MLSRLCLKRGLTLWRQAIFCCFSALAGEGQTPFQTEPSLKRRQKVASCRKPPPICSTDGCRRCGIDGCDLAAVVAVPGRGMFSAGAAVGLFARRSAWPARVASSGLAAVVPVHGGADFQSALAAPFFPPQLGGGLDHADSVVPGGPTANA